MSYQPSPLKQLFHNSRRFLAKNWLSHQKTLQIAVTGSQGKTNTTQILAKVLSAISPTIVTDPDLDTTYNVPISALKVFSWTKFAVFELGIDHVGEMDEHLEIVKPKIGIITGISPVHTDREHLGSLETLIKEKRKLIEALSADSFAILNYDDENVRRMTPYTKAKILWYGTDKNHCDVWAGDVKVSLEGTIFKLFTNSNQFQPISTKLIGEHHIYTIMATYLALEAIKQLTNQSIPMNRFIGVIKKIKPLTGRMNVESGPLGTTILNDSLRANPSSTTSGLMTLSEIEYPKKAKKIAVLTEMGELEHPVEEHKKIGQLFSQLKIDFLVAIGPMQKYLAEEAVKTGMKKENVFWVKDVIEAAQVLKKIVKKDDLIYLKGSLLKHVERVLLILEGRKVGCDVISCQFYWHCPQCQYLEVGYQNKWLSK